MSHFGATEIDRGARDESLEARPGTRKVKAASEEGVEGTTREVEGSYMRAGHNLRLRRTELALSPNPTRFSAIVYGCGLLDEGFAPSGIGSCLGTLRPSAGRGLGSCCPAGD